MKKTVSPWLAALACACLAVAPVAGQGGQTQRQAQQPAQEPQPSLFGEQIEVRVVNVEVVATDRQGNRVADLKPSDLRLTVDGKPVPIEYFTEVRGGQAIAPPAGEAAQIAGLPTLAPGEPVGTSYLVFIDDFFTLSTRRDEVLRSLKETLFRLGPEDRMAVVAFDGRSLELLSSWSNSHRNLSRALDKAMSRRGLGAQRITELRDYRLSRRISVREGFGPMTAFRDRLDDEELDYAVRLRDQVTRSVEAATSSLRGFAKPPGRKVMLLLSGGWPFNISNYVVADPTRPVYNRYEVPPGEKLIAPLVDTANRLGYTIYPVDVPGIETDGANADVIDVSLQVEDVNNQFPGTNALLREQEVHSALEFVAQETGAAQRRARHRLRNRLQRHPVLLLARLHPLLAGQRQPARDPRRVAAAGRPDPFAQGLPRPVAQGRGVVDGGERHALRRSSGDGADADPARQAGPRRAPRDGPAGLPGDPGRRFPDAGGGRQARR
jgi:VWFA-related protein